MEKNKKVSIHAYKYDGWLYRTWEFPMIIDETDDYICLSLSHCHVITASADRKHYYHSRINHPAIWYLFKKKWYNLVISKKNNKYIYYINVASPFIYEEETFKYVDLDLDFRFYETEKSTFNKLDQDEFEEHSVKFKYPPELINKIKEIETDIVNQYHLHKFKAYFNKKTLDDQDEGNYE